MTAAGEAGTGAPVEGASAREGRPAAAATTGETAAGETGAGQHPQGHRRSRRRRRRTPQQRRRLRRGILLQIVAMIAIGLLVYPQAADWFARLAASREISGYLQGVEQTPSAERQRILDAAYAYNQTLQVGPLTDPYIEQNPDEAQRTAVYQAYENLLRVSGTDAIGTLSYPALDIGLPIYHGTADETLSKGLGHLYGTSLPVGGPNTHAVLTAHSGLIHAKLLTNLTRAQVGDVFWISVLGEDHRYQVMSTETVLPNETDSLKIVPGEDWVTLFTCTPIGVNSHRFMVHAKRIADTDDSGGESLGGIGAPGFPWWAVWFVGGSAVTGWIILAPPRRKRATRGTGRCR